MQRFEHHFTVMGGPAGIILDAYDEELALAAITAVQREVTRLEAKYSRYQPESLASRINRAAGKGDAIRVDEETIGLLDFADTLWRESDGLFDPTSGILRRAWDFGSDRPPRQETLEQLLPLVGWEQVHLDQLTVYLPQAGMELDFGGFVKEYAVDSACKRMQQMGVTNALVNLAGDLAVIGTQGDGRPWRIGICGADHQKGAVSRIKLVGNALASSGDYERCIELGGKRFGHVLHPATGWPVQGLTAVSIVAPQCLVAGALATIAMLMPSQDALSWLAEVGLPWLAIGSGNQSVVTGNGRGEAQKTPPCRQGGAVMNSVRSSAADTAAYQASRPIPRRRAWHPSSR
jgi:thiamine biosynthesis lipoprotein